MTVQVTTDDSSIDSAASALSAGLERFTIEALRKWGEALDRETPRSLGERLLCFADSWRVAIEAESEACKTACVDFSYHFPAGSRERDVLQRMAVRLDMRSNVELSGPQAALSPEGPARTQG